jgi:hypothetical protein
VCCAAQPADVTADAPVGTATNSRSDSIPVLNFVALIGCALRLLNLARIPICAANWMVSPSPSAASRFATNSNGLHTEKALAYAAPDA